MFEVLENNEAQPPPAPRPESIFAGRKFASVINELLDEIQELYLQDRVPWVVGFSGGKDSSAVLQLIWSALSRLSPAERGKPVHVISTNTKVENPIVDLWVSNSLIKMRERAAHGELPVFAHRLEPALEDSFWVNLIGKGYAAPRPKFRWCTERLKIKPANAFIRQQVDAAGASILALGTRKAESLARRLNMEKHARRGRVRDRLSPDAELSNCQVYTPIEDWSNDDVWLFLMQTENAWGVSHKDLLALYQGASEGGECPLVRDTATPSCGSSRFGCWVCTLVEKDRSMQALIENNPENEWMLPLIELRNEPGVADDRHLRDFRRMNGRVQIMRNGRNVPGPYLRSAREHWLARLLEAQVYIRANGPDYARNLELISLAELRLIRNIWVMDKHEIEDSLPKIYRAAIGVQFPDQNIYGSSFGAEELKLLEELCGANRIHYEMIRDLLAVEMRYNTAARRNGLFKELEKTIARHFYSDESDALERAGAETRQRAELHEATAATAAETLPLFKHL